MKYIVLGAFFALLPVAALAQGINLTGGVAVESAYDLTTDTGTEAEYPLSFYINAEKNDFFAQL